jgi:hypothetical protein
MTKARFACTQGTGSACGDEPLYDELDGHRYCVLHFPGQKDIALFRKAVDQKLTNQDFNFRGVWFPEEQRFSRAEFSTKADFVDAVFNADAGFLKANFAKAAYFNRAEFRGAANFSQAGFRQGVNFSDANFAQPVSFYYVHFNAEVDFTGTAFHCPANFYGATFGDHVRFAGGERAAQINSLDLQFARIEKPDRVYFHSLTARPSWFVNVDVRRFDFIIVNWDWQTVETEADRLRERDVASPHQMLAIAYRRLAINAEENHRYEEASKFRYRAMEAARRQRDKRFEARALSWLYWLVSGYGERVWQALVVLLGILLLFAAIYTKVGFSRWQPQLDSEHDATTVQRDDTGAPLPIRRALTYSGAVMTLQQPEPRPATPLAHAAVLLETILGPLQAALLALAIRRKFMR